MISLQTITNIIFIIILLIFIFIINNYNKYYNENKYMQLFPKKLDSIKDKLDTGDLILFMSGIHSFMSSTMTGNFYSHVGIIYKDDSLDETYIYEITTNDIISGKNVKGIQMTPISERIKNYIGVILLCKNKNIKTNQQ